MNPNVDMVMSRFRNLLERIRTKDPDFDDLCGRHADVTARIRRLSPEMDPREAELDADLRRRRAALEQEMFAIMHANSRI